MEFWFFDPEFEEDGWDMDEGQPNIRCPQCGAHAFFEDDCPHLLFIWGVDTCGLSPCGTWDPEPFSEAYKKAYFTAHPRAGKKSFSIHRDVDFDVLDDLEYDGIELIGYQDSEDLPMGGEPPVTLYGYSMKKKET